MRRLALLLLGLLLAGCASAFPKEVVRDVDRSLTLSELVRAPEAHLNQKVMLGGEILATLPRTGETEIEVLGRRLRDDDSPERSDRSDGRFIVRTRTFLDPAIYASGRRVTVVGRVAGAEERKINEVPYRYPVIESDLLRLWAKDSVVAPYPYYYYPYYYYPYYHFGFYRGPFHWRHGRYRHYHHPFRW
jgi:outer membrane lipoprotein